MTRAIFTWKEMLFASVPSPARANVFSHWNFIRELHPYYLSQSRTFLGEATNQLKIIMEQLWELRNNPEIFRKKICIFELLNCLMENKAQCEKKYVYYNSSQIDIAKKAEQILTKDLSQHIPIISEIAAHAGYSKQGKFTEVFKSVYGQAPLEYRRKKKMESI